MSKLTPKQILEKYPKLHSLFERYSFLDLADLVIILHFKPILDKLETQLGFLGAKRNVKQNANNNTVVYRFPSEIPPVVTVRLKIEINSREHFTVLGLTKNNLYKISL